jgi:hypothetical protein
LPIQEGFLHETRSFTPPFDLSGEHFGVFGERSIPALLADLRRMQKKRIMGGPIWRGRLHRLLPLHFNFCLTTLKNEASGNDANGSVFFALRMVTTDPRSTCIGLRPSNVKNTG